LPSDCRNCNAVGDHPDPLPALLQRAITAVVIALSADPRAAQELTGFLASPAAAEVMKVRGFEPL